MSENRKNISKKEIETIALEYIDKNPSNTFNYKLVNINFDDQRYPSWSVIFEMRTHNGDLVDGPLVLGIDESGEIIFVG